jgi:hypothetical protein
VQRFRSRKLNLPRITHPAHFVQRAAAIGTRLARIEGLSRVEHVIQRAEIDARPAETGVV